MASSTPLDGWGQVDLMPPVLELMQHSSSTFKCHRCGRWHVRPTERWVTLWSCPTAAQMWRDTDGWTKGWEATITHEQWLIKREEDKRMAIAVDANKLRKRLQEQGFTIEETKAGWRVKSPDGKSMHHFHPSSLDGHAINIVKDLEGIGFVSDQNRWKQLERERKEAEKQAEIEANPFECPVCGRRSPRKINLYRHLSSAHPEQYAQIKAEEQTQEEKVAQVTKGQTLPPAMAKKNGKPAATKVVRRSLPDEELSELTKMRRLNDRLIRASQVMAEAATAMLTKYETMHQERDDLKTRLDKLEKLLGKAVDLV